jgi:hypothetical protein
VELAAAAADGSLGGRCGAGDEGLRAVCAILMGDFELAWRIGELNLRIRVSLSLYIYIK